MSVNRMRLVLGIMFLLMAGFIFARQWVAPGLDARFNSLRMSLGGVLALVFGGLNIARWYSVWSYQQARATPIRTPLQRDPSAVAPQPPDPELDFTRDRKTGPDGGA